MCNFEYVLKLRSTTAPKELAELAGAKLEGEWLRIPAGEREAELERRFLELAALDEVQKAAVSLLLPSKLRLGSLLYESRWVYFTVTEAEIDQHLRVNLWDYMAQFFLVSLPGGKHAYAIRGEEAELWSVDTAKLALYLGHACRRASLIQAEFEPSATEQALISALPINLDYYDYLQDSQKIRFIAELTYDEYFTLRDYQYLLRLARERMFRYDTPLYSEEGRIKYGLETDIHALVAQSRRQFPDRPYQSVDVIVRNEEGAQECFEILQAIGFGVLYIDEDTDRIWDWPDPS